MYRLKYRRQARNYLARLPLKTKTAMVNKLHELAANPDNPDLDIEILKGRKGFRLRVGQYRVIYTRQDDQLILEVVRVRFSPDCSRNDVARPLRWACHRSTAGARTRGVLEKYVAGFELRGRPEGRPYLRSQQAVCE